MRWYTWNEVFEILLVLPLFLAIALIVSWGFDKWPFGPWRD